MILEKNPKTRPIYRKLLELGDNIMGRAFPQMERASQVNVSSCGPAVICTLFSNLGVEANQRKIVSSLRVKEKIKKYGLNVNEMAKAAKNIGKKEFTFWKKNNAKLSDLKQAINKYKSPVGVEWQGVFYEFEDEDNGHYSVVTRFDKKAGYLRIADPFKEFQGVDRRFNIKFFEKRWWDENDISVSGTSKKKRVHDNHVMFVITPKNATWPKKLGMKKG